MSDAGDALNASGPTTLDIWLDTFRNRNGSIAPCNQGFLSYEFILHAVGGTISWGTYNDLTGFSATVGVTSNATDFHVAFGGGSGPGSGLNKVGSLSVEIASGNPCLDFATGTALSTHYSTSLGSCCFGARFDNTLRLGSEWSDADGITLCSVSPGAVSGAVSANCPAAGTGLLGVTVDAFQVGSGDLVASAVTDQSGNFMLAPLPAGDYVITIVTPLGYAATISEQTVTVVSGGTASASFGLTCVSITANPRTIGYWKHQAGVATGGNGAAQVDGATLCSYLDRIQSHFNTNAINQVVVYQPPPSGLCADKLEVASSLLNLQGSVAMVARARQQLMALLLNVAAGYISLTQTISADGATVSQAITYCDNIIDNPAGDYEKAKTIADKINNGITVPAGMIPLSTAQIAYRRGLDRLSFRATCNPDDGAWTFRFATPSISPVAVRVYDIAGRHLATVFEGRLPAGAHTLQWDGRIGSGRRLSSGLYFARLSTGTGGATLKLMQLRH